MNERFAAVSSTAANDKTTAGNSYEVIKAEELARRWSVPVTWIYEQTRWRCQDPLPVVRLGKYVRFEWGSPQLEAWWDHHRSSSENQRRRAPHIRRASDASHS